MFHASNAPPRHHCAGSGGVAVDPQARRLAQLVQDPSSARSARSPRWRGPPLVAFSTTSR
eukprot:11646922-Heterocapsa_arctica.AAC.1